METDIELKDKKAYFYVFWGEFIGTFMLMIAINFSNGNAMAIGLTLFMAINIAGRQTGAHFNPAVTIGIPIINNLGHRTRKEVTICFVLIILAEFLGAAVG